MPPTAVEEPVAATEAGAAIAEITEEAPTTLAAMGVAAATMGGVAATAAGRAATTAAEMAAEPAPRGR